MDLFFVLLALLLLAFPIIAIAALVKSVGLGEHLRRVDARLAALERGIPAAAPPATAPPTHEPIPPAAEPTTSVAEPETPAQEAPAPPEREPPIAVPSPIVPPPQPAPIAPRMSLEERLGTQWAVWVGGLAVVLGGVFLVRYSIEQGLLGPGVRVTLGALLAVALIAAGEWTRRSERLSGIAGLPTAHIPSILTAAGTTVAMRMSTPPTRSTASWGRAQPS
jgi:uncharacterized membrane protein